MFGRSGKGVQHFQVNINMGERSVFLVLLVLCGLLELTFFIEAYDYCKPNNPRTPCAGTTIEECVSYDCCWSNDSLGPSCFFQNPKYVVMSKSNTTNGIMVTLGIVGAVDSWKMPGSPISPLQLNLTQETQNRLHIKITDPNNQRWEIPESVLPTPPPPAKPVTQPSYEYQVPAVGEDFYFAVFRKGIKIALFDTSSIGFKFSNQFLQIGTTYPSTDDLYGLGEHKTHLKLNNGWPKETYTLWNYDGGTPDHLNLYGSHPFYMDLNQDGSAHGVFLRNSNGMDVDVTNTTITYNIIGGVLDFYFFLGPEPNDVINQYQEVIGRPAIPPYWALGFHQCKYGYKDIQQVKDVLDGYMVYQIPLDTVWTDIDYMDGFKDFTNDPVKFPAEEWAMFINDLHRSGQHYVVIVDVGIGTTKGYKAYDDGLEMDIFIKDNKNEVFIGKVWPGLTAYPDFAHPQAAEYWTIQVKDFIEKVPIDGIWIDMNEPSNFCDGACNITVDKYRRANPNFDPVNPPYTIANRQNPGSTQWSLLKQKTLDMDATHYNGVTAYDMHNLYGISESIATQKALMSVYQGKRPFILSRSTFAGSGAYVAHWLGDNEATQEDLYYSIPTILSFQMFGVPFVGADICGFSGDTTEELCSRWTELGAFYPFARNHDNLGSRPQEPYRWDSVAAISRKYYTIRYSLLPYYYTLFFLANHDPNDVTLSRSNGVVLQPLFFAFTTDSTARAMETQFLVGDALLICPQYNLGDQGKVLDVYLPAAAWYDWYTHDLVSTGLEPITFHNLDTPMDFIPMYIRGGYMIPMQEPGLTTTESRKNPYSLIVALDHGLAEGNVYLDDGETYNTTEYTFVSYTCSETELYSSVKGTKYATKASLPMLRNVTILGLSNMPTSVALDGVPVHFTFTVGKAYRLMVDGLSINMDTVFHLKWM